VRSPTLPRLLGSREVEQPAVLRQKPGVRRTLISLDPRSFQQPFNQEVNGGTSATRGGKKSLDRRDQIVLSQGKAGGRHDAKERGPARAKDLANLPTGLSVVGRKKNEKRSMFRLIINGEGMGGGSSPTHNVVEKDAPV